jgi:hypothetical protein
MLRNVCGWETGGAYVHRHGCARQHAALPLLRNKRPHGWKRAGGGQYIEPLPPEPREHPDPVKRDNLSGSYYWRGHSQAPRASVPARGAGNMTRRSAIAALARRPSAPMPVETDLMGNELPELQTVPRSGRRAKARSIGKVTHRAIASMLFKGRVVTLKPKSTKPQSPCRNGCLAMQDGTPATLNRVGGRFVCRCCGVGQ